MTIINTPNAPAPIGPYNQAIIHNGIMYMSGQIALHPTTGELVTTNIKAETKQVMDNIAAILAAANTNFNNIIKTTIFITDMKQFAEINEVYGSYFNSHYPARETVQVSALPKFVNVEISITVVVNG